jgi:uncharacterized membrane protein
MTRADWFRVFLFVHVLGAVSALGPTLTYGLWVRRGELDGAGPRAFALRTISWIDRRLATPSYVLQAVTGTALILLGGRDLLRTAWLLLAIGIYIVMVVFAVGLYAPAFRRQREIAERLADRGADAELEAGYLVAGKRAAAYGSVAVVLTVLILFLMVVKPALWSAG